MQHKASFIDELDLSHKLVFLRADLNVPLDENLSITDDHRIKAALDSIKLLQEANAKTVLVSHLGRPKGKPDPALSLKPVAERLQSLCSGPVIFCEDSIGTKAEEAIKQAPKGSTVLLENVRFYEGEKKNETEFAKELSHGCEIYINDAFGTAHRAHASTVGVANLIDKKAGGLIMKKELGFFQKAFEAPKQPLITIFGGSKVSTKLSAIKNVGPKASSILIGGAMANTFFAAKGLAMGKSLVEKDLFQTALDTEQILASQDCRLLLPIDLVVAKEIKPGAPSRICKPGELAEDEMALDIGPETLAHYGDVLGSAETIIWNGPMGVLEIEDFAKGTYGIVGLLADSQALTVVGGGDTDLALQKTDSFHSMDYVSTGGGAFLTLLEGSELPAVTALG